MRFRAILELNGKTATGMQVPDAIVTALGSGARPPIRVTLNGYTYRTTVARMGGRFLIGVNAGVRQQAGVAAGDELEVELELDTAPREVTVPSDLASALAADEGAGRSFEKLSYSNQRQIALALEGAKTAETRQRRLEQAVKTLRRPAN
jgi:hypothetical protein